MRVTRVYPYIYSLRSCQYCITARYIYWNTDRCFHYALYMGFFFLWLIFCWSKQQHEVQQNFAKRVGSKYRPSNDFWWAHTTSKQPQTTPAWFCTELRRVQSAFSCYDVIASHQSDTTERRISKKCVESAGDWRAASDGRYCHSKKKKNERKWKTAPTTLWCQVGHMYEQIRLYRLFTPMCYCSWTFCIVQTWWRSYCSRWRVKAAAVP
jgi:hypothetical protein